MYCINLLRLWVGLDRRSRYSLHNLLIEPVMEAQIEVINFVWLLLFCLVIHVLITTKPFSLSWFQHYSHISLIALIHIKEIDGILNLAALMSWFLRQASSENLSRLIKRILRVENGLRVSKEVPFEESYNHIEWDWCWIAKETAIFVDLPTLIDRTYWLYVLHWKHTDALSRMN